MCLLFLSGLSHAIYTFTQYGKVESKTLKGTNSKNSIELSACVFTQNILFLDTQKKAMRFRY